MTLPPFVSSVTLAESKPMIRADDTVTRRTRAVTAEADDELVMLDAEQGTYFGLNATARRIWELLETPQSARSLCDTLVEEFRVEREACLVDLLAFLAELADADLASVAAPP